MAHRLLVGVLGAVLIAACAPAAPPPSPTPTAAPASPAAAVATTAPSPAPSPAAAPSPSPAASPSPVAAPAASPAASPSPAAAVIGAPAASPGPGVIGSLSSQVQALAGRLDRALSTLRAGNLEGAQDEFDEFFADWDEIAGDVETRFPDAYERIEDGIEDVMTAMFEPEEPNPTDVAAALTRLRDTIMAVAPTLR